MKPSLEEMPENSLDLLFFQYVEGELDAEQTRQLEQRLAADAALREELGFWQESFVRADFHDTRALENTLLAGKNTHGLRFNLSNCVLLLLLAAMLFRPASASRQKPVRFAGSTAQASANVESGNTPDPATNGARADRPGASATRLPHQAKTPVLPEPDFSGAPEIARETVLVRNEAVAVPPLQPRLTLEIQPIASQPSGWAEKVTQVKRTVAAAPKKQTRQQRRQIIRMKEKALQQRNANEFLKGDIPYVVPLKTDNF